VAELTSVDNQNLVALVGSKDVHTVVSHDIIGWALGHAAVNIQRNTLPHIHLSRHILILS